MIIFLYGADTYRSRQKLNEIVDYYKKIHKSGLNLKFFDGENLNFQDFENEVETISIFREKKLIVLKDIFLNKDFQEKFLKKGKKFANSENIILIYEKEIDKNNPFFEFLKKNSKSQEFLSLEGQRLKNWAKREFEKYQTEIKPKALDKLIDFVGNDLWQLSNEIKKLTLFKSKQKLGATTPKKCQVNEQDIELLVRPKIEPDIFETIDAIASKNKKRALQLLKRHLEKGDSPLYLLSMINFQFRNLLVIKDLVKRNQSPYTSTRLHPYVIKKSLNLSKKFEISELKKIYQKIFEIDLDIKTGKIDPQIALDLLITEI